MVFTAPESRGGQIDLAEKGSFKFGNIDFELSVSHGENV